MDHNSMRARRGRRMAGGLVALVLVTAVGLGGSSLAGAVEPADDGVPTWEGAEGAVPVETTETETRAQRAARETDKALDLAKQILGDKGSPCDRLISGATPAGGKSASEVLAGLLQEREKGNRLKFDDLYDYDRHDAQGNRILAYADGDGTAGHMVVYQGFHRQPFPDGYFAPLSPQDVQATLSRYGGAPSAEQARAMIILHELAHLTGRLGAHTDASAKADAEFDLYAVYKGCLRGAPPADPSPGGGGGPGDDGGYDGGEDDGGFGDFPDPPDDEEPGDGEGDAGVCGIDRACGDDGGGFDPDRDDGIVEPGDDDYDPGHNGGDGGGYDDGGGCYDGGCYDDGGYGDYDDGGYGDYDDGGYGDYDDGGYGGYGGYDGGGGYGGGGAGDCGFYATAFKTLMCI